MRLEKEFEPEYNAWKTQPSPATTGALLRKVQPAIDRGVFANVGKDAGPVLRSSARRLALEALRTYDPQRARLSTHVINHMQGLRRLSRQQQQVLRVPERVSLDQTYLMKAEVELSDQLGRDPSTLELADYTGISPKRITKVRSYRPPIAEGSLMAMMSPEGGEGSMPSVEHGNLDVVMRAVYEDLDPINQKIIEWTLGLNGQKQLSNQLIASKLRLTPGAVSQRKAQIQARLDEMSQHGIF